jgi:hypothetical protein
MLDPDTVTKRCS